MSFFFKVYACFVHDNSEADAQRSYAQSAQNKTVGLVYIQALQIVQQILHTYPNNKYRFKIEALSSTTDLCHMSSHCYYIEYDFLSVCKQLLCETDLVLVQSSWVLSLIQLSKNCCKHIKICLKGTVKKKMKGGIG